MGRSSLAVGGTEQLAAPQTVPVSGTRPAAKKPKKDVSVSFKQMDDDEEEEEEEKGKKMNGSSEEFHNNDNHKNEDIRKEANETNDKNTQL